MAFTVERRSDRVVPVLRPSLPTPTDKRKPVAMSCISFSCRCLYRISVIRLLLLCILVATGVSAGNAADFRVVTQIYQADDKQPLGENTTIFYGRKVYDFPTIGDQITCFERDENQFVVLDTAKRTWTRIPTDQLLQYTAWLKDRSGESDDPLLRFCSAPKFEMRSENDGKRWFFNHPVLQYQVEGISLEDPQIGIQYRAFGDWYARLNTMLRPQSLPPFPRILVNQKLVQQNLLPREVELRISSAPHIGNRELVIRSVHTIHSELSEKDHERLVWLNGCREKFSEVKLIAYRSPSLESAENTSDR